MPTSDDIIVIIPGEDGEVFIAEQSAWDASTQSMMPHVLEKAPDSAIKGVIEALQAKLPKTGPLIDRPPREDYGLTGPEATYVAGAPQSAATMHAADELSGDASADYKDTVGAAASAG